MDVDIVISYLPERNCNCIQYYYLYQQLKKKNWLNNKIDDGLPPKKNSEDTP